MKRKRGEQKGNKVFWSYAKQCVNGEWWISKELYDKKMEASRIAGKSRIDYLRNWQLAKYKTCPEYRERRKKASNDRILKLKAAGEWKATRSRLHKQKMLDPVHAFKHICRTHLSHTLKAVGRKNPTKAELMLGCSYAEFKSYIESKFKDGMTWENKNEWEWDHIIPMVSATTLEEVAKLSRYTNIQPLWKNENREKGTTISNPII